MTEHSKAGESEGEKKERGGREKERGGEERRKELYHGKAGVYSMLGYIA